MAVTDHLYRAYPHRPEGELSPIRASVVSQASLAEAARGIDLGPAVRLGKGEDNAGGRDRPSILSDALEAVFAAVYLDGGWDRAAPVVVNVMAPVIAATTAGEAVADAKSHLQEIAAERFDNAVPSYTVTTTGPDHAKHFDAQVRISGRVLGQGQGRSKKEAEQAAAGAALAVITADGAPTTTSIRGEEHPHA